MIHGYQSDPCEAQYPKEVVHHYPLALRSILCTLFSILAGFRNDSRKLGHTLTA
jgi:hypothetical protein